MKSNSSSQTLITGTYRTGSQYLTQLIGCHPSINASMYSVNVLRFVDGRYDPISKRANYTTALADVAARVKARYGREVDIPFVLHELDSLPQVDYGKLYDILMCHLYLRYPATHWAEKCQLLWREIPRFLEMMPNGRAILILRDPRSVLVSFKRLTYATPPAYLGAIFNCFDAMKHAMRYQREIPERVLVVRYEDAACKPQQVAEQCWRFMNIDGTSDVTQNHGWMDSNGKPWHSNTVFKFNDERDAQPFDVEDTLERWRGRISDDEIALTEGICGDLMETFDYQRAGSRLIDWPQAMKQFIDSPLVLSYFRKWLMDGEGIEEFPTDPLKPENWSIE